MQYYISDQLYTYISLKILSDNGYRSICKIPYQYKTNINLD